MTQASADGGGTAADFTSTGLAALSTVAKDRSTSKALLKGAENVSRKVGMPVAVADISLTAAQGDIEGAAGKGIDLGIGGLAEGAAVLVGASNPVSLFVGGTVALTCGFAHCGDTVIDRTGSPAFTENVPFNGTTPYVE